jgi:hypothetical protein
MNIRFCPINILRKNLYIIGLLLCAHMLGMISKYCFGHDYVYGLVRLFNFDTEQNIPTLYSTIALLFSSILVSLIAFRRKQLQIPYIPWLWLSLIFLFMSIDEASSIHELLVRPAREISEPSGVFYHAWVVPYGLALVVLIIAYSKFLFELPKRIMTLFLISGAIFVLGSVGFECLAGRHVELYGSMNILYDIMSTCEELLEMIGIALFIYALLTYISNEFEDIVISITEGEQTG